MFYLPFKIATEDPDDMRAIVLCSLTDRAACSLLLLLGPASIPLPSLHYYREARCCYSTTNLVPYLRSSSSSNSLASP